MSRVLPFIAAFQLLAGIGLAQGALRGQIYGPDGKHLLGEVRFQITSSDGSFNQYYFSDSNGRIVVPGLRPGVTYTLTIDSDGSSYGRFRQEFNLENMQFLSIFLPARDVPKKSTPPQETVSVAALGAAVPAAASRSYQEGVSRVRAGKLEDSARHFRQAITRHDAFFEAHNDLGVVLMKLNRMDEAEEALRRASSLKPRDCRPLLNLGMVLARMSRHGEAIEPLSRCLEIEPENRDASFYLGESLLEAGRPRDAQKHLEQALESDVHRPAAMIKLAIVKVEQKDDRAAVELLEKYLAEFPRASNRREIEAILEQIRP